MSFLDFFKKKTPDIETKSNSVIGYGDGFLDRFFNSSQGYVSAHEAMEMSRTSSSLGTAVGMIAQDATKIRPVLKSPDGQIISDHEVLRFLDRPNNAEDGSLFRESLFRNFLLVSEAPMMAEGRINRAPLTLWSVKSQFLSVIDDQRDKYAGVINVSEGIAQGAYARQPVKIRDPFRYVDPSGLRELFRIFGFSSRTTSGRPDRPVETIYKEISVQIQLIMSNNAMLSNGARPSAIIGFNDEPDDMELAERKRHLSEQIGGSNNAGKIMVTRGNDYTMQQLSQTNKDMDFENLYKVVRNAVFSFYQIPLQMIATDSSTFNNMEQARDLYYQRAVIPTYDRVIGGMGNWLLPRFGLDPEQWRLTYNPDEIEALQSKKLDELQKRKEIGIETINEMRDGLPGREPLDGGNTLYQNANLVAVGEDIFTDDNIDTAEEARRIVEGNDENV